MAVLVFMAFAAMSSSGSAHSITQHECPLAGNSTGPRTLNARSSLNGFGLPSCRAVSCSLCGRPDASVYRMQASRVNALILCSGVFLGSLLPAAGVEVVACGGQQVVIFDSELEDSRHQRP
jgi:hypothetical protein